MAAASKAMDPGTMPRADRRTSTCASRSSSAVTFTGTTLSLVDCLGLRHLWRIGISVGELKRKRGFRNDRDGQAMRSSSPLSSTFSRTSAGVGGPYGWTTGTASTGSRSS